MKRVRLQSDFTKILIHGNGSLYPASSMIMETLSKFSSCTSVFTGNSFPLFVREELFYFHASSARQSLIK